MGQEWTVQFPQSRGRSRWALRVFLWGSGTSKVKSDGQEIWGISQFISKTWKKSIWFPRERTICVCLCAHVCVPACTRSVCSAQMRKDASKTRWGVTSPTVFGVSSSVFNPGQHDTEVRPSATAQSFKQTPWRQTARATRFITIRTCLWLYNVVMVPFGP